MTSDEPTSKPIKPWELTAGIAVLILGLMIQDAIFFHITRDWTPTNAVMESVTKKGQSWHNDGLVRHESWKEGTYLYKVGESVFRGYRIELVPLIGSGKAPRNYLPRGEELPGSSITVRTDPAGLYGSYFHEGNTAWLKIAYYASWAAGLLAVLSLVMARKYGLKRFAGLMTALLLIFALFFAFSYDGDRVLEPDERLEDDGVYELLSYTGQFDYRAPRPTELQALREGMTMEEVAALIGRPPFLTVKPQRLWWGYDRAFRPVQPAAVFELKDGVYRLTHVSI